MGLHGEPFRQCWREGDDDAGRREGQGGRCACVRRIDRAELVLAIELSRVLFLHLKNERLIFGESSDGAKSLCCDGKEEIGSRRHE